MSSQSSEIQLIRGQLWKDSKVSQALSRLNRVAVATAPRNAVFPDPNSPNFRFVVVIFHLGFVVRE
jgi:hypothetical protein